MLRVNLRCASPLYESRRWRPEDRRRRRHLSQRNRSRFILIARLPFSLRTLLSTAKPSFDIRHQIEVTAADEDASPEGQFSAINGHAQYIKLDLKDCSSVRNLGDRNGQDPLTN